MTDDMAMLDRYVRHDSEEAFAALASRHVNLVYSVALRQVGNAHLAEEITQAVFIILARKAGSLNSKMILSGWLCRTARYVSANALKIQRRRRNREEAYMQSVLNEPEPETWTQIAPLLDTGLAELGAKDHDALVLRYFENRSLSEVGAALGASEEAAKKRVSRALEKLRKFFASHGVISTTAIIAGAVSANSVQAAPAGLAKSAATVAIAKGVTVGGSTLTLIKGALKIMAWTKAKIAIAVVATTVAVGTTVVVTESRTANAGERVTLADGSVLVLNRITFGEKSEFTHGAFGQKLLGNLIPAGGLRLGKFNLARPKRDTFNCPPGKSELVAEFRLISSNPAMHPLVKPAFYRQFRCVIRGEQGIEYAEEFWPDGFREYADGYYSYVSAESFPRDSRWLWLRIEQSETNNPYGPWQTIAEFKVENSTKPVKQNWVADPVPTVKTTNGMDFVLNQITVATQAFSPRDIWNHIVTVPFQVRSNGILLTNWGAQYVRVEDASGNWDYNLRSHRSLDPRYVWKLEADFEPQSDYPQENLATVSLSRATITTNVMGVPVTISWDGQWIDAKIPTNRSDIALKFINVTDDQGANGEFGAGSWWQYSFRKGDFMFRRDNVLTMVPKPAKVAFAVFPNLHATFYAQPQLLADRKADRKQD